ncbi:PilN family type IVB pilus formation outer membrane protein [Flexibacterium corallicola]|uniref:PilN family type IVB pilus formation outer membrane protein n=1 Tax=Flexibacterium corallicola TaxID=3037259 RepID=UPI00286F4BF6|nr:PilN family type IVB pilus formation outer membrane protein [Pseudovibrio sp. M1P-2-3]
MTQRNLIALLFCLLLVGCNTSMYERAHKKTQDNISESSKLLDVAAAPMKATDISWIQKVAGVYIGSDGVRNERGTPLPARYERESGIFISREDPFTLREIATFITQHTQIPVILATADKSAFGGASSPIDTNATSEMPSGPVPQGFPMDTGLAALTNPTSVMGSSGKSDDEMQTVQLNYKGALSGLLNIVSANYNLSWRYDGETVVFDSVLTRTYDIPALPSVASMQFDLASNSQTSADSGGVTSGQSAGTKSTSDVWTELDKGLASIIPENSGQSFSVSMATGVVTVTADPNTQKRVASYLKIINDRLSQQVALSVKVYTVSVTDTDDFDIDIGAVVEAAGKYGLAIGNAGTTTSVPSVAGAGGSGLGWAILNPNNRTNGSNLLLKALSSKGDVSVVTTASVTTLNGIPVPLQVGEQRDYVRSVQVTTTEEGTESSIEPGTVSAGFNLQLLPRVDRSGDLLLQYGITISELTGANDGFDTFESNGTSVQLRRLNQRNLVQHAKIPNGSTLVLAGFEQVSAAGKMSGTGSPRFQLLGGSRASSLKKEIVVISITPTLLDIRRRG